MAEFKKYGIIKLSRGRIKWEKTTHATVIAFEKKTLIA